jgi:hypothetical protein
MAARSDVYRAPLEISDRKIRSDGANPGGADNNRPARNSDDVVSSVQSERHQVRRPSAKMVDGASVPGLPAAEESETRSQAKSLVRGLITGARSTH